MFWYFSIPYSKTQVKLSFDVMLHTYTSGNNLQKVSKVCVCLMMFVSLNSTTTGSSCGAGTAYLSGASWYTHGCKWDSCCYSCAICQLASRTGECFCTPSCVPAADINLRTRIRTLGGIQVRKRTWTFMYVRFQMFWYSKCSDISAFRGAGTAYLSGASWYTHGCKWDSCCSIFSFLCNIL
jgi:hypothetical protein